MAKVQDLRTQMNSHLLGNIEAVHQNKITDSFYGATEADKTVNFHSIEEKGVQAGILNNFRKIMDSENGQQVTHSSNYGPYVMEVWPVVVAWYPDFPLKDLICVQDMDKPLAYLFFSKLLAGTTKAGQKFGDVVENPLGQRVIKGNYPTGEVMGEVATQDQIDFDETTNMSRVMTTYAPLNVSVNAGYLQKIKITIVKGSDSQVYVAGTPSGTTIPLGKIENGVFVAVPGLTLDIETGLLNIPEEGSASTVTEVIMNYVWNIDYATVDNIPKVKEDIELVSMEATPRALAMEWTIFSEYLKKSQFGMDVRESNTKRILNLLYQFQVRYILDDLYTYAQGAPQTITIPNAGAYSLDVKASKVAQQLKQVGNLIEIASGRMEGNRLVVGASFKAFLESLPNNWYQPVSQENAFSGPREIGTFATNIKVFYDPTMKFDEAFMTYRGSEWYDAAYYMGTFVPIVPTDAIALAVTIRQSFCSMEAYKYHKPNCVFPIKFVEEA